VIDGAAARSMSVYGYHRRTTPILERLAARGAVFEYAYSNSSWTRPSTPSFLTSLHHSVLGGLKNGRNSAPAGVSTIAEHLQGVGFQTASFTTNPNASTMSGLGRGIDVLREAGVGNSSTSYVDLHDDFWKWREAYPAEPYWARFQPTDVHSPNIPVPPFAGLFVSPQVKKTYMAWREQLEESEGMGPYADSFEKTEIDRQEFFDVARGVYDETMAHQDYQIGRLVERLEAGGDLENTLLIIASDHSHAAGTTHFGLGGTEELPPIWDGAMLSPYQTRIPLIFVWPGRIPPGQRFREPVSMIDVLPTVLDLVGIEMPEVMQGQSLAPLLLGGEGWEPRPVIFDEIRVSQEGEYKGWIEVIDGRWGASLIIDPSIEEGDDALVDPILKEDEVVLRGHRSWPAPGSSVWENLPARIPRLLLYDLWRDPHALHSVHEEHPDLVAKYTAFLETQWEAHRALAGQFTRSEETELTSEQLETLRSLGYVR